MLLDKLLPTRTLDGILGVPHLQHHVHHCYCLQWTRHPPLAQVAILPRDGIPLSWVRIQILEDLQQPASPQS